MTATAAQCTPPPPGLATNVSVNHVPRPTPTNTTAQLATRTFRKSGRPSSALPNPASLARTGVVGRVSAREAVLKLVEV